MKSKKPSTNIKATMQNFAHNASIDLAIIEHTLGAMENSLAIAQAGLKLAKQTQLKLANEVIRLDSFAKLQK